MARRQLAARKKTPASPRLKVINPGKGLNVQVSDNLIDNREASDLQNIAYIEAGGVSKRTGYRQLGNNLSNNPRGLGSYMDSASSKYVCTIDGTALKYLKDTSTTWTSSSGSTFTTGKNTTFTQARGLLYIWNGTEGGTTFDGSTCARPGTMPKGSFGLFYKSFHFVSGVTGQLNRVYISVVTDASDFTNAATTLNDSTEVPGATVFAGTGANFIDVDKDDGDQIKALCTFQDSVIVFKERSIHQITLDSSGTPSVALVTRSLGCVSHKSVENCENDVFFLSRRGVYVLGNEPQFFSAIRTNELSARINPRMKLISEASLNLSTAIYYDYKYWLGVPEGGTTTNNLLWTYDRRFLAWSRSATSSFNAESFTVFIDSNSREKLLFTSASSAKVFEVTQSYNDNDSAIDAYWTSKAFDAEDFDITKRWLYCRLQFRQLSGSVTINIYTDNDVLAATATIPAATSAGELGSMLIGQELLGGNPEDQVYSGSTGASLNVPYQIKIGKKSRTLKVKVSNSTINQNFVLTALVLEYQPLSPYVFPSANKLSVS